MNSVEAAKRALHYNRHFLLEHPEDLGQVQGECPGTIWQWDEVLDLLTFPGVCAFAIHQCMFRGRTPKPTRFMTSLPIQDIRCWMQLPRFDSSGYYVGPLPRDCGHQQEDKLIGKSESGWKTSPSAAYLRVYAGFLPRRFFLHIQPPGGGARIFLLKGRLMRLGR